jgi:hypothetical protein
MNAMLFVIFMGLVFALAALLFVMIAYGHGPVSGPRGFPSGDRVRVEGEKL